MRGFEEFRLEALADDVIVAWKARGGCLGCVLAGRDERVDTAEQSVPLRSARGIAEPFRRQKGRNGHGLRVTQSQIGQRRKPGLEAVDDVEPPECKREREVRTRADGDAD